MLSVELKGHAVIVNMHGTAYQLTKAQDVLPFKADMGWFDSLSALVEKYLDKLVRVVKRVAAVILIAHADVTLYLAGKAPMTFWQEQKLRWCN
jgi:hypothetical protein